MVAAVMTSQHMHPIAIVALVTYACYPYFFVEACFDIVMYQTDVLKSTYRYIGFPKDVKPEEQTSLHGHVAWAEP